MACLLGRKQGSTRKDHGIGQQIEDEKVNDAYALIDRFLRENLNDSDYSEYSEALEEVRKHSPFDWHAVTLRLDDAHDESMFGRHGKAREIIREVNANIRKELR